MKINYLFRSNTVILISDTHNQSVLWELVNLRIPNGSDCCSLGDNGIGFGEKDIAIKNTLAWLEYLNSICSQMDVRVYIIIGNHDAPYSEIWDSKWSNVFLTKSGEVGLFPNGKKALLVGGGISVDRYVRKEGSTYWKNEITPKLDKVEKCDIMFSHDCPEYFNHRTNTLVNHFGWYVDRDPTLLDEALAQRITMTDIAKKSEVQEIISGHYHNAITDECDGVKYRCLDINELYEYDSTK